MVAARERGYVCVCNVHTVMASREDAELREALRGSALNVPDGQPLVWAINSLGHSLAGRVYGPELMSRACDRAVGHAASASTCTAGATRARSSSSRSTSASATRACASSAATRRRTGR